MVGQQLGNFSITQPHHEWKYCKSFFVVYLLAHTAAQDTSCRYGGYRRSVGTLLSVCPINNSQSHYPDESFCSVLTLALPLTDCCVCARVCVMCRLAVLTCVNIVLSVTFCTVVRVVPMCLHSCSELVI